MADIGCISESDLQAFLLGELPPRLADTIARHLELCPDCEERVRRWDDLADGAIQALRRAAPPRESPSTVDLSPGTVELGADGRTAPTNEMPSPAGFTVLEELGRGALGVVYKARQHHPERVVALKCLLGGAHSGLEQRARFLAEADAIARLNHPHIVQVHAAGEYQGLPFLCLEYLGGGTLEEKTGGFPQPPRAAAQLVELLARAVQHAHEHGVIHRDLKPANILLSDEGRVTSDEQKRAASSPPTPPESSLVTRHWSLGTPKISDFGLARFSRPELTATGAVMGTPSYMAPEQARGDNEAVGPAADVWALGAILYEQLTGQPPFRGVQVLDTLEQVATREPVAPSRLQPKVPRDLETICLKCLEKQPARRYASARELAEDLGRFGNQEPIRARPLGALARGWRWCQRNPALALAGTLAAGALVAVAVVSLLWAVHSQQAADDLGKEKRLTEKALAREKKTAANLRQNQGQLKTASTQLRKRTRLAERRLAENTLDQALKVCNLEGDPDRGMLELARALEVTPAHAGDLRRAVRINLAAWRGELSTLRAILPHPQEIAALAFSPDGKTMVVGGSDHTARLWSVATGKPIGPPLGQPGPVIAAAFSPDGQTVATTSGYGDKAARLWSVATGKLLAGTLPYQGRVDTVAFLPGGKTFFTAGGHWVQLWSAATGKPLGKPGHFELKDPGDHLDVTAFSPDGRTVLTSWKGNTALLLDLATAKARIPALLHQAPVHRVAFSPDGKVLLTISGRKGENASTVLLWKAATGKPIGLPLIHDAQINATAFSQDARLLVTACGETVRVWEVPTGRPVGAPLRHRGLVRAVALSPDGKAIVAGGAVKVGNQFRGEFRLWRAARGWTPHRWPCHAATGFKGVFNPRGEGVLIYGPDKAARQWDLATRKVVGRPLPGAGESAVGFSPDGKAVALGDHKGLVRLWSLETGRPFGLPLQHKAWVSGVTFSRDGKIVLTGSWDKTARLWSAKTGQPLTQPLPHPAPVQAVALDPRGRVVLTGGDDGIGRLWDAATGKPRGRPMPHRKAIWAVALSPDGQVALTGSFDGTARLWSAATGKPLTPPLRHQEAVWCLAFSPDGRTVVTGSSDHTARLWDAATGKQLGFPLRHQGPVPVVAFSPDGTVVLTGSRDTTARLWDAATTRPIGPPLRHESEVRPVAFSPDGRLMLTGSDNVVRVWQTPVPVTASVKRVQRWVQALTGMELHDNGTIRILDAARWRQRRRTFGN
jgi:WD40 repeat protein/serine/threonine protein kinase